MNQIIVESPQPLTTEQLDRIKVNLNLKQVEVVTKTNPSLIAGLKITYLNKVLDTSLKNTLSLLYDQLVS